LRVLESGFAKAFIKMADDGFQQGWHERNGGTLTYRLREQEIEQVRSRLKDGGKWKEIGADVLLLKGN